jgi:hypothetical protein
LPREPSDERESARTGCCCEIGRVSTNVSASTRPDGKWRSPPSAIGNTKMLIARRYAGKSHTAFAMWRSSTFSTTDTWNWRGRNMIASIETNMSVAHVM